MVPHHRERRHIPRGVLARGRTFPARGGGRPTGYFAGGGEDELEGREAFDGTIFVRGTCLALHRLGWAHESGRELGDWDIEGYYNWRSDDRDKAV